MEFALFRPKNETEMCHTYVVLLKEYKKDNKCLILNGLYSSRFYTDTYFENEIVIEDDENIIIPEHVHLECTNLEMFYKEYKYYKDIYSKYLIYAVFTKFLMRTNPYAFIDSFNNNIDNIADDVYKYMKKAAKFTESKNDYHKVESPKEEESDWWEKLRKDDSSEEEIDKEEPKSDIDMEDINNAIASLFNYLFNDEDNLSEEDDFDDAPELSKAVEDDAEFDHDDEFATIFEEDDDEDYYL